jgi:hypothetical protein
MNAKKFLKKSEVAMCTICEKMTFSSLELLVNDSALLSSEQQMVVKQMVEFAAKHFDPKEVGFCFKILPIAIYINSCR